MQPIALQLANIGLGTQCRLFLMFLSARNYVVSLAISTSQSVMMVLENLADEF